MVTLFRGRRLVAAGGVVGGHALYIKSPKPVYEYNWFRQSRCRVASSDQLPLGPNTIRVDFKYDGGRLGRGATVTAFLNDKKVDQGRVAKTVLGRFSADETFDVGTDIGSPVSDAYQASFKVTGSIQNVEINLTPTTLNAPEQEDVHKAESAAARSAE